MCHDVIVIPVKLKIDYEENKKKRTYDTTLNAKYTFLLK